MSQYAYTIVTGKLATLFKKINDVGPPDKVTTTWLKSVGFKSSNDPTLLRVLKQVDFVDQSGAPTDRWKEYRGSEGGRVLAEGIRHGYRDLFDTYANAHSRSNSELESFFTTHSDYSKKTVAKVVRTFRSLCELAEFDGSPEGPPPPTGETPEGERTGERHRRVPRLPNVGINVNVQLVLPDGADADSYDALFAAMRKHLFPEGAS